MSEHDEESVVERIGTLISLRRNMEAAGERDNNMEAAFILCGLNHGDSLPGGNEVVSSRFMVQLLQNFRDMATAFVELAELKAFDNVDLDAAREALVLLDDMINHRREDSGHGRQNSH